MDEFYLRRHQEIKKLAAYCHRRIKKDQVVLDYLKSRKVLPQTIDSFQIGVFPKDLREILSKLDNDVLIKTNIIYNASASVFKTYYPLVIPVLDVNGYYVGIAGRTLLPNKEREAIGIAKYKNSSYDKADALFCLSRAIPEIRKQNKAIVVEGHFDAISSHQAGITNTVATCGTALSKKHVILLARYTDNIDLMFDNDPPGNKAAERALLKRSKPDLKMVRTLPPEPFKDIDEYLASL